LIRNALVAVELDLDDKFLRPGGQSLIADLVARGATGEKGYTDEPPLQAIASPTIQPLYVPLDARGKFRRRFPRCLVESHCSRRPALVCVSGGGELMSHLASAKSTGYSDLGAAGLKRIIAFGQTMTPILLEVFGCYIGREFSAAEAFAYVATLPVMPISDKIVLADWRVHVPMPFLERWLDLTNEERVAIFVMATSATHPHECLTPRILSLN
jgi:hypothetical protein